MTDQKETTTATWQDCYSGKRGHQLMTQKLAEAIPALGATEHVADCDDILAHAKLFSPYSNWTWYIAEWNAETGQCFGLVEGFETELGYFDLTELAETTVSGDVPAVERDLYWQPMTLGEIKGESRGDLPRGDETVEVEAMTDETGTDISSSDVVNVEEFLFGQREDDGPDDASGERCVVDATEDAADDPDAGTAAERNADVETTQEPDVADDDGEPAASPDDLKVVLSIKGGRATIGVQRPSADPHIEAFDDPDLFGLADQFPAVVARARARWEEEPRHPAYVKPAPPARRRNRRQQQPAPTATDEGQVEQHQPETLRLF